MTAILPDSRIDKLIQGVAIVSLLTMGQASAARFGDLTSLVPSDAKTEYRGNSISGNTMTRTVGYINDSTESIVIDSVFAVHSLDPEDLGFPDLAPSNLQAIRSAMLAMHPNSDLLNVTGWQFRDPSKKDWSTELVFSEHFPIRLDPGEVFQYTRISTNDVFGPDFGPKTSPNLTYPSEIESIGEVVIAIELTWHIVPEPTSAALLFTSLLGMVRLRVLS